MAAYDNGCNETKTTLAATALGRNLNPRYIFYTRAPIRRNAGSALTIDRDKFERYHTARREMGITHEKKTT